MNVLTETHLGWSSQASVFGSYSAQVSVVGSVAGPWTPIVLHLKAESDGDDASLEDSDLWSGSRHWVNGLVSDEDEGYAISENLSSVRVKSYVARFANRPLGTESWGERPPRPTGTEAATVINQILYEYLDLPTPAEGTQNMLVESLASNGIVTGPVEGNNVIEELRKVAAAGRAYLFVNEEGKLTCSLWRHREVWKEGEPDYFDVIIPKKAVQSVSRSRNITYGPSEILVRGAFYEKRKEGVQPLTPKGPNPSTSPHGPDPGKYQLCGFNGIEEADAKAKLEALRGDRADLLNSDWVAEGVSLSDIDSESMSNSDGGSVEITIAGDGGGHMGSGSYAGSIEIEGEMRPKNEFKGDAVHQKAAGRQHGEAAAALALIGHKLGGVPARGGPAGSGSAPPNKGPNQSGYKYTFEMETLKREVRVEDSELFAQFGVAQESIENPYVPTREQLFDLAIRRFQEFKMQQREYEIELTYLPHLQLNQRVRVYAPGDVPMIDGFLMALGVNFQGDPPQARMKATVWSMELIGNTEYVSPNLWENPDLSWGDERASSGGGAWNVYDPDVIAGAIILQSVNGMSQTVPVEGGEEVYYDLTFAVSGGGGGALTKLEVTISDGSGVLWHRDDIANESFALTFTDVVGSITMQAAPLVPPGEELDSTFQITNLTLKKRVTR